MICDRVFFVLTRGPFPTGELSVDQAVETHLLVCQDCRRLAEALRPAAEFSPEGVTREESRGLPGYWGQLGQLQGSVIDQAISCLEPGPVDEPCPSVTAAEPLRSTRWSGFKFWQFAAAVTLGAALGTVLRYWDAAAELPKWDAGARRSATAPAAATAEPSAPAPQESGDGPSAALSAR